MSSSIPQRHSPQFTPAPLPIPTRRPTHRANLSLTDSEDGSLDSHNSNANNPVMTQHPYQDADEDPLRRATSPVSSSYLPAHCHPLLQGPMPRSERCKDRALKRVSPHEHVRTRRPQPFLLCPPHPSPGRPRRAPLRTKYAPYSHPHLHRHLLPKTSCRHHWHASSPPATDARPLCPTHLTRYDGV